MQRLMLTVVLVLTCVVPLTPVPPPPPLLLTTLQAYKALVDEHLLGTAPHLLQTLVLPSFDRESAVFIDDAAAPRVVARRVRRSIWTLLTVEVINGTPRARRWLKMSRAELDAVPVEVETCEAAIDVDTARGLQALWRETVTLPPQAPDLGQRDGTRWIFAIDDDGQRRTRETTDPDASANNTALAAASELLTACACAPAEQREQRLQRVRDLLDR